MLPRLKRNNYAQTECTQWIIMRAPRRKRGRSCARCCRRCMFRGWWGENGWNPHHSPRLEAKQRTLGTKRLQQICLSTDNVFFVIIRVNLTMCLSVTEYIIIFGALVYPTSVNNKSRKSFVSRVRLFASSFQQTNYCNRRTLFTYLHSYL